jgi:hypothetical protein
MKRKTIGSPGKDWGVPAPCVGMARVVCCPNTAGVHECHVANEHLLCELVENALLGKQQRS